MSSLKQDYRDESFLNRSFDGSELSIDLSSCVPFIETVGRNGIQKLARSVRLSSTNQIKHYAAFGQHRTGQCPRMSSST